MRKKLQTIGAAVMLACTTVSAAAVVPDFTGFTRHIYPRENQAPVVSRKLPAAPTPFMSRNTVKSDYRFVGWNDSDPVAPAMVRRQVSEGEMLDEVTGVYLDGKPLSKQTFQYTENGNPLRCDNYVASADGEEYVYNGHYAYEYDAAGRVTSAEKVSVDGSSVRYEYLYSGDSQIYNCQMSYRMDESGKWIPYQKGEYEYDSNLNTTKETYSQWVAGATQNWLQVVMNEATYDELNRLTSYFPYIWDATTSKWIGNNDGAYAGQRFVYTKAGNDALQADYTWEDGQWLEYHRLVYTYDDSDLLICLEKLYWNRIAADWSGGDAYGEWGDIKNNAKEEYTYDQYGRLVTDNVYKYKNGKYVNNYRMTRSYVALEDGETEITETSGNVSNAGQDYSPNARNIVRINRFGSESYFCSYKMNDNDEWVPQQEEIRYFMEGYHWFTGGDYYYFNDGVRVNSSKERFYYSDDFNPELDYKTPYEGRHWVGSADSEDGWKLKSVDKFTWGPRDVMTGYIGYNALSGTMAKESAFEVEYDFTADCAKIFFWPDSNLGDTFYENKTLKSTNWMNPQANSGIDEWNDAISYEFTYHYSPRSASVRSIDNDVNITEIARHDVSGRRLASPAPGINIITYSDGSVRKVII